MAEFKVTARPTPLVAQFEKGVAGGVGTLDSKGYQPASQQNPRDFTSVLNYGALGNGKRIKGLTCTTAGKEVTVPTASFTEADVGKYAICYEDFASGTWRTIEKVIDATHVELNGAAGITKSATTGVYFLYGSDDSAAILSALEAAKTPVDNTVGYNEPHGLGQGGVLIPALASGGLYILAKQIAVPSGVIVDSPGMIVNAQSDRFAPILQFEPYTSYRRLYVECLFGGGVQLGKEGVAQADIEGDKLTLWQVGETREVGGEERRPTGLSLQGSGFLLDLVWMKGSERGILHNPGSDSTINRAHLIGCKEAARFIESNQIHYGEMILDSCGVIGGGFSGVVIDHASAYLSLNIMAFEVNSVGERMLDNVVGIGTVTATLNKFLRINVMAQKTGGNVVNLAHAQDVMINILASNTATSSTGGKNITTAVVFGEVAGSCKIDAAMNTSITPYSGTVGGSYTYQRSGVRYHVQGGSAPTPAALPANGTTPPTPTVSAADGARGNVLFGSGTTPTAGAQISITFSDTTGYVAAPNIQLEPLNAATAELIPYVTNIATTGFQIAFAKAPAAEQAATIYQISYAICG